MVGTTTTDKELSHKLRSYYAVNTQNYNIGDVISDYKGASDSSQVTGKNIAQGELYRIIKEQGTNVNIKYHIHG